MRIVRRLSLLALVVLALVIVACGSDPTAVPTAAPTATAMPTATATSIPRATQPSVPTVAPTVAPRPTATVTPVPTPAPTATPSIFPLEIVDGTGETITFDAPPQRIVSFSAANTEILFALGLGDSVVGRDAFSDYPAEALNVPSVGDYFAPDLEAIVAMAPDLVFITFESPKEKLLEVGLRPLFIPAPDTLAGVIDIIIMTGQLMGRPEEAAALAAKVERDIQEVVSVVSRVAVGPRVYYEDDPGLWTAGPATFIGDMITIAKGQNVAAGAQGAYPQLSNEFLVEQDPEVILLGDSPFLGGHGDETPESIAARPGWGDITAVQNGRVHPVSPSLLTRPGPRIGEGLRHLAEFLYPELFS